MSATRSKIGPSRPRRPRHREPAPLQTKTALFETLENFLEASSHAASAVASTADAAASDAAAAIPAAADSSAADATTTVAETEAETDEARETRASMFRV